MAYVTTATPIRPFKRGTAAMFYWIMAVLGTETVPNHADYRLLGRRALSALLEYREENLFLRGIVPSIGSPSTKVYYRRVNERLVNLNILCVK